MTKHLKDWYEKTYGKDSPFACTGAGFRPHYAVFILQALPFQWGILLEYFNESGIIITRENAGHDYYIWDYRKEEPQESVWSTEEDYYETDQEQQIAAKDKAFELINK